MITDKQKKDRERGIGSSDVPTILGLNKWASPYDLWLQRTGQTEPSEGNEAMELGSALEIPILALAAKRLGEKVHRPSSAFVGCQLYYRANIDGMVGVAKRGSPIVEAKTTGMAGLWGEDGTDQVPESVKAQVMYQMMCSSSQTAHIAVLVGDYGLKFKMFRVEFDVDYAEVIADSVDKFWTKNIEGGIAPDGVPSIEYLKGLTRRDAIAPQQIPSELFDDYFTLDAMLTEAEAKASIAKAKLMLAMGDFKKGTSSAGDSIVVSEVTQERFNGKMFKAEYPELAAQFVTEGTHSRIAIKKGKTK